MAQPKVEFDDDDQDSYVEDCLELLCMDDCTKNLCPKSSPARWIVNCFFTCFVIALILIVVLNPVINSCGRAPAIDLKDLIIRDLSIRNVTAADATPWQVISDINITVYFKSRTPVIGCFTKVENMTASVYYGRDLILSSVSVFSLNITVKPSKTSRAVSAQLKGNRVLMTNEVAELAAELRGGYVTLELEITIPSKSKFEQVEPRRVICTITATLPEDSETRPGTLVGKHCKYIGHEIVRHAT